MISIHIQQFLDEQQGRGLSPATLKALRSDLLNFVAWWETTYGRQLSLPQLVARDVRRWQRHRQQHDGVAPKTINRNLVSLRRFCQWAVDQDLLPDNPATEVGQIPQETLSPRFLPKEAVDALLRAPRTLADLRLRLRDQALLALLVYAGLRSQEVRDLQLRDVDLVGGAITVRRGKGSKERRVPLHSEAQTALAHYLDEFRCPTGFPAVGSEIEREPFLIGLRRTVAGHPMRAGIQTRVIQKRIKQLGQMAAAELQAAAQKTADLQQVQRLSDWARQVEHVSPHQLRHSLARRLLQNGAHLPEVQRILGHSRLSTTGMYLLPSDTDLQQAIERAGV